MISVATRKHFNPALLGINEFKMSFGGEGGLQDYFSKTYMLMRKVAARIQLCSEGTSLI
jgi:hypothetical protein